MASKQAVLRVVRTKWKDWYRIEVRRGHKGTGKLLHSREVSVYCDVYPLTVEYSQKVSKEHGCEVLNTFAPAGEYCVYRYLGDDPPRWFVFPICIFDGECPSNPNEWQRIKNHFYFTGKYYYKRIAK